MYLAPYFLGENDSPKPQAYFDCALGYIFLQVVSPYLMLYALRLDIIQENPVLNLKVFEFYTLLNKRCIEVVLVKKVIVEEFLLQQEDFHSCGMGAVEKE